jgi:nucleotide-binding universal stress UspA family protein
MQMAAAQTAGGSDAQEPQQEDLMLLIKEPGEISIADEAKKGYGLTLIGFENAVIPKGGLHPRIVDIARDVAGPIAISAARQDHVQDPLGAPLHILVPVNGSDASLKGAEIAFAFAAAERANVLVLHVTDDRDTQLSKRRSNTRQREAVLRDVAAMADRMKVEIRTAVRLNLTAEDAILRQARLGGHNLIVMGVGRRTNETFAFSQVAESVLEASDRSVVVIAF